MPWWDGHDTAAAIYRPARGQPAGRRQAVYSCKLSINYPGDCKIFFYWAAPLEIQPACCNIPFCGILQTTEADPTPAPCKAREKLTQFLPLTL